MEYLRSFDYTLSHEIGYYFDIFKSNRAKLQYKCILWHFFSVFFSPIPYMNNFIVLKKTNLSHNAKYYTLGMYNGEGGVHKRMPLTQ